MRAPRLSEPAAPAANDDAPLLPLPTRRPDRLAWFFGAVLAVNLGLLAFYEFVTFRTELTSDSAVKVLLAEEILHTGQLFPMEWVYANGDLYAFHGHTLAIPLIPLLGAGFVTHAVVGLLVSLLLLLVSWLVLRELRIERWQRLAVLALVASGVSSLLAENLFGQATYGFIVMMNVAALAAGLRSARQLETHGTVPWRPLLTLAVLSLFVSWNNPDRALVILGAPFLAACVAMAAGRLAGSPLSWAQLKALPERWLVLAHVSGFALGALAYRAVMHRPTNVVDTAGLATWLGPDAIWRNVGHSLLAVLAQLGGVPVSGGTVVSGWGVYEALRLVLAIALLVGVVQAIRAQSSSPSLPRRFIATFALVSGALALLFFVFTTVPGTVSPMLSGRYLLPSLYVGFLLLPTLMRERPGASDRLGGLTFGAVAVTALLGVTTLALPGYGSTGRSWESAQATGDARASLLALLKRQGLRYGYATYWNAGALSVLSDGELKVRQVELDGELVPMHLHASSRWFRPAEWQGETFLLLSQAELKRLDRRLLDAQLGAPSRQVASGDFTVFVYANNPANRLSGWNELAGTSQAFQVTAQSPHIVGSFQPGERALVSAKGDVGELLFGPWLWLAPGHYWVSFDVAADGTGPVGTVEVKSRKGQHTLATAPLLPGVRGPRVLEIELANEEKFVEFRVLVNGSGAASVHGVKLERAR